MNFGTGKTLKSLIPWSGVSAFSFQTDTAPIDKDKKINNNKIQTKLRQTILKTNLQLRNYDLRNRRNDQIPWIRGVSFFRSPHHHHHYLSKQSCSILTGVTTFGLNTFDPCPGVRKYAEVHTLDIWQMASMPGYIY